MKRLRKFLRHAPEDRRLLINTALLLGAIRLGLSLLPFRTLRSLLTRATAALAGSDKTNRPSVDRLIWAVTVASRYVPRATCLTQALAAQVLLARQSYPAQLRIGVARGEEGRLEAHAWLESQGMVVIGGSRLDRYVPLPAFEGKIP